MFKNTWNQNQDKNIIYFLARLYNIIVLSSKSFSHIHAPLTDPQEPPKIHETNKKKQNKSTTMRNCQDAEREEERETHRVRNSEWQTRHAHPSAAYSSTYARTCRSWLDSHANITTTPPPPPLGRRPPPQYCRPHIPPPPEQSRTFSPPPPRSLLRFLNWGKTKRGRRWVCWCLLGWNFWGACGD